MKEYFSLYHFQLKYYVEVGGLEVRDNNLPAQILADLLNPTYARSRPTDATLVRPRRALAGSRRPLRVAQGCARAVGGAPRALVVQPTSLSRTGRSQA